MSKQSELIPCTLLKYTNSLNLKTNRCMRCDLRLNKITTVCVYLMFMQIVCVKANSNDIEALKMQNTINNTHYSTNYKQVRKA